VPSVPGTLLRMIPMPQVRTCAPQSAFSGIAEGPRPGLVLDGDLTAIGNPVNCWIDFFPRASGNKAYTIAGVTRDANGNPLAGCTVKLYTTVDDIERYATVSDANGNFSFNVPSPGWTWYAVAYLPGSPDVAGTTVNTLAGV
jgi:hypothetical protein